MARINLKNAMQPRGWSPAELKFLRALGLMLLLAGLCFISYLMLHRFALEAQATVWRHWINSLCVEGDPVRCKSQFAYTEDSGLPKAEFWTDQPALAKQAGCLSWHGLATWRHLSPEDRPSCGGVQPVPTLTKNP